VRVKLLSDDLHLTEDEMKKVAHFHSFTFREVLRLEKYPMMFDPPGSDMGFYVVPLRNNEPHGASCDLGKCNTHRFIIMYNSRIRCLPSFCLGGEVDWAFLDAISFVHEIRPRHHDDEERKDFVMNESAWVDSVVMPWYRSQDQPQVCIVRVTV
jgi:endoribonuclease Dicer